MAKKNITGFPIPFGIKSPNKMFRADSYAGPYDSLVDAKDTIEPAIRELGREVGIIRPDGRGVDVYVFEKDTNDDWILVLSSSGGGGGGTPINRTSDIPINDGEDGVNPYISKIDIKKEDGRASSAYGYSHAGGYSYFVWGKEYFINNVLYPNYISDTVTLAPSDPLLDRYDALVINDDNTITSLTGVASDNPVAPYIDITKQLLVGVIKVVANTTVDPNINTDAVYDENTQIAGGEADTSTTYADVDFDSTEDAYSGSKSAKFTNSPKNSFAKFKLKNAFKVIDFTNLIVHIKLTQVLSSDPSQIFKISIEGEFAAGFQDSHVAISSGTYGFDADNTATWQTLVIPIADFKLSASRTYRIVVFRNLMPNYTFFLDRVLLQKGATTISPDSSLIERTSQIPINDGNDGVNPYLTGLDVYGGGNGGSTNGGNILINYGIFHIQNYDYFVWADKYIINRVTYTNYISEIVTLSPGHTTFDRVDAVVINSNETITVVEGTPSATPVLPTIDYETQLLVKAIEVKANTTEPDDIENILIYDENTQIAGGEADTLTTTPATVLLADTSAAYSGTKSILFQEALKNNFVRFKLNTPVEPQDFDVVVFHIKNKESLSQEVDRKISLAFISPATLNSTPDITIINGDYGYNSSTLDWQTIAIPVKDLKLQNLVYEFLTIRTDISFASFHLDLIFLQKGLSIETEPCIMRTSDIPINDGEDGTSRYTEEKDFKTIGGQTIIGVGDIPAFGELEKITENGKTGYRLRGKNPANYGEVGDNAIDLSISNSASLTRGATGTRALAYGINNINNGVDSLVGGSGNSLIPTNTTNSSNIVTGENNIVQGVPYDMIVIGEQNVSGTSGATYPSGLINYSSIITGYKNTVPAGVGSATLGGALLQSASFCTVVGLANEDITLTPSTGTTHTWNTDNNPRFIVGVGSWNVVDMTGTRKNGFVVMGDGKVSIPEQTIAHINTIGDKAVITKEYADATYSGGGTGGIQSVTGDGVSGTPEDVVLTFPTLQQTTEEGNETTKSIILSSEEHPSESIEIGVKEFSPGVGNGAIEIFSANGYGILSAQALGFSVGGKLTYFSDFGIGSLFSDGKDLTIKFPTNNPIPSQPNINTWLVLSVNGAYANDKGEIRFHVFQQYPTITALLADQSNQLSDVIYKVIDASDDPNITFPSGETKLHAYYQYKEVANGVIGDYDLVSVPYGKSSTVDSGLVLGETSTTAHRGDHGKHAYDSIVEIENTNYSTQLLTLLNF